MELVVTEESENIKFETGNYSGESSEMSCEL